MHRTRLILTCTLAALIVLPLPSRAGTTGLEEILFCSAHFEARADWMELAGKNRAAIGLFRERAGFLQDLYEEQRPRGIDENMPILLYSPRRDLPDPRGTRIEDEMIRFTTLSSLPASLPLCVEDPVCLACSDLTNNLRPRLR